MELEEFNRKIVPMRQELLSMARRQTRDDAIKMLEEEAAERCGKSYEEYHKEVMSEM